MARAPVRVGASTDEVGMAQGEDEADTRSRHVMVSYACQQGKDCVVQVSAGLRERGFDVWRDEDGSNLVMKMNVSSGGCSISQGRLAPRGLRATRSTFALEVWANAGGGVVGGWCHR